MAIGQCTGMARSSAAGVGAAGRAGCKNLQTNPCKPFVLSQEMALFRSVSKSSFDDSEMSPEDGVVIVGADALARGRMSRRVKRVPLEGFRNAEFAGEHVALENFSGAIDDARIAAGHPESVVAFFEIAFNWHYITSRSDIDHPKARNAGGFEVSHVSKAVAVVSFL